MSQKAIQISFLAVFTAGFAVLLFFIFKPYLGVVFVSGILSIVFYPLFKKLTAKFKDNKSLAALVTTLLILIFIIIPLAALSVLLLKEAVDLYNLVALGGKTQGFIQQVNVLLEKVNALLPVGVLDAQVDFEPYVRNILNWVIGHFDSVFATIFGGVLNFFLMLVSLYYLFILGDKIKDGLVSWSPLPDKYDEEFIQTLKSSVDAVLRGRILVAAVQGLLIGVGFAVFGVGSPVLWGFVGGIASLIPMLGTSIVTVPAIAFLFFTHHFAAGLGLLIWGSIIVGLVDNVFSVVFLRNKIKIHPLIVLFSILGGVEVFGAIGLLAGPVVVSAFLSLIKIYPFIVPYKNQQP